MKFEVIDKETGDYPNVSKICREEAWAENLIYCDINGFYIGEDGGLILVDDCGNSAICPANRFEISLEI